MLDCVNINVHVSDQHVNTTTHPLRVNLKRWRIHITSYAYYLEHRRTQAPGQGCTNDDGDVPCSLTVSWGHAMSLLDPMMWNVFESLNVSPVFSSIALQMNEQH